MDPSRQKELEMLALERLNATADDDEQWSYAWGGEGAVSFAYCPWSQFEHEEFYGWVSDLNLPWSEARLRQIEDGGDLNETELHQWRRAKCRRMADAGEAGGTWIVPMKADKEIEGFAVWLYSVGAAPEDPPILRGIFDSIDEAKAALSDEGIISEAK